VSSWNASTDPAIAHMRITLDHATLALGRVTSEATNESKELKHELVVVSDRRTGALPIDAQRDRIDIHAVRRLGEIADLAPGKSGKLTLYLGPGSSLLLCNRPGHFKDGTVAKLTIAP
jgi:uncharacterized cupredoxin-like copper-binding protein